MNTTRACFAFLAVAAASAIAYGDEFNMPGGLTSLEFVNVGNPGNAANSNGYGAVGYSYHMGKYDITAAQYTMFLNAVAATDRYALWNRYMADPSVTYLGCNIQRSGLSGSYSYSVASDWANRPVNYVSIADAMRFVNWLSNGEPGLVTPVAQNLSSTEDGSYYLNGATSAAAIMAVTRKPGATFVLPSEDEWYKAAYFDPNKPGGPGYWLYPTKSDAPPINTLLSPDLGNHANFRDFYGTGNGGFTIGSPYYRTPVGAFTNSSSPYGTFDQGGNVWQLIDTSIPLYRGLPGGAFDDRSDGLSGTGSYMGALSVTGVSDVVGFRAAYVPEPGAIPLLLAGFFVLFALAVLRKVLRGA